MVDYHTGRPYVSAMPSRLHAVIETPTYLSDAARAGMDGAEREAVVLFLAANPKAGDVVQGTGGARKVRFRRPGTGKSGGYRLISYFGGDDVPLFLLNVFAKGDRDNLSQGERNILRGILAKIVDAYRRGKPA